LHGIGTASMVGVTDSHVKVSLNVAVSLKTLFRGTGCSTYMADMRVKISVKDKAWFFIPMLW